MQSIEIPYKQIKRQKRLLNESGHTDILGAILVALDHDPLGMSFPSELKQVIFPFTTQIKGRIVDTEITLGLCRLSELSKPHPLDLEQQVNKILNGHLTILIRN